MIDILQEAVDDYSYNRRIQFFKKSLPIVICLTIIIIALFISQRWYYAKTEKEKAERIELLLDGIVHSEDKPDFAVESYKKLMIHEDSISELAHLELAKQLLKTQDKDTAATELLFLINNNHYTENNRALAKLEYIGIKLDKGKLDENEQREINKILSTFDKNKPYYSLSLIYAFLYHWKLNNKTAAMNYLQSLLTQDKISETIRSQIQYIANHANKE